MRKIVERLIGLAGCTSCESVIHIEHDSDKEEDIPKRSSAAGIFLIIAIVQILNDCHCLEESLGKPGKVPFAVEFTIARGQFFTAEAPNL
jgi:hypothetical protein